MLKPLLDRFATEGDPPELAEAQILLDEALSSHSPLS
jgi:hypothetical protein